MNKVIAVFANGGTMTTTQTALWQYDYGQILVIQGVQLPTAYEVHFCNSKDSTTITSIGDTDGVVIPDQFLQNGEVIYAYVYLHTGDSDGETEYKITIPVMDRAEPTDIEPTPAQESTIGQLISALNDAVDTAEEAASRGPVIQNDYWYIWDSTAGEYVNTNVKAEGVDGENGNIIWWTTDRPSASGDNAAIPRRRLNGPEGLTPSVGDYVFAPDVGEEGEPTTLYVIISSTTSVIMTALGRIVGPAGEDGYSPDVTITEIEGGHRVTITDEEHPSGQSFDVMDGTGSSITVDSALSDSSENPVQNKVIKAALDNKGTYSKPSGGIPASDLASGVIPAVPSASSATPQALGTAAAGSSTDYSRADHVHAKPTYTKSDVGLGNVDNVQQYSTTNPPPYPVSSVNGQTGAVTLSIPSTAADVGAAPAVTEVTVSTAGDVTQALDPGKIYHFTGAISSLTLTLTAAGAGQIAQYHFDFDSGSTAATISLTGVNWQGGSFAPAASKHYEVDILNGYGVVAEW